MITCKLTKNIGKGVKAHIVPESFYELPPQSEGPYKLMTNISGIFPKKLPIGVYDSTIVTKEGESLFDAWDDYAARLLIEKQGEFKEIKNGDELVAWQIPNYNYEKIKLFALSVLWRADASKHVSFSKVNLGSHEEPIREMLLNNAPGKPEEYSVNIVRWIDDEFGPVFMDPFREKYEGVNYYRLYCGRYVLYIKVDKRKTIKSFNKLQLGASKELHIIARELRRSKEWPIMEKIAKKNALTRLLQRSAKSRAR